MSSSSPAISTPPTDVSDPPEWPLFNTEEIGLRRAQSDRASREIGNRLLQGWTMLADECPNPTCYGVPLVRPPKTAGGKDSRKECVICGTSYIPDVAAALSAPGTVISTGSGPAKTGSEIATQSSPPNTDILHVLEESSRSLQATLHSLSTRLASMDPTSICSTADAILKVTQALSQVKELERSELQHHYRSMK